MCECVRCRHQRINRLCGLRELLFCIQVITCSHKHNSLYLVNSITISEMFYVNAFSTSEFPVFFLPLIIQRGQFGCCLVMICVKSLIENEKGAEFFDKCNLQ